MLDAPAPLTITIALYLVRIHIIVFYSPHQAQPLTLSFLHRPPSILIYSGTLLCHRRTMSNKPQSYASHAKFDPAFHFFVLPVQLITIFVLAYILFRHPGIGGAWLFLIYVTLLV